MNNKVNMQRLNLMLIVCLCFVLIAYYTPANAYSLDDYLKPEEVPKMEASPEGTLLSAVEASKLIVSAIENGQVNTDTTVTPGNGSTQPEGMAYPIEASLNINGVQTDLTATVIPNNDSTQSDSPAYSLEASLNINGIQGDLTATVTPKNDSTQSAGLKQSIDATYSLEGILNINGVQTDLTATIISNNVSGEPNCAAYSLQTSLNINGVQADLTQLSQELAPYTGDDTQTSFEGIVKVAEKTFGVTYYGGQLTFKELKSSGSGTIVNLDLGNDWGHYVVYDDFAKGEVTYWDEGEL